MLCGVAVTGFGVIGAGAASAGTQNASPAGAEAPSPMPTFANCQEVNKVFPYGVGDSYISEDKATGTPSTNFYPDSQVYWDLFNQGHDRDLDGIACEKPGGDAKSINFYADRLKDVGKSTNTGNSTNTDQQGTQNTDSQETETLANPYTSCDAAEKKHLGPIDSKNRWYEEKLDPNHNGIACEANTVWRGDKAYVLKSSVSHPGKTAFTYLGHDYVERSVTGPKVNTDRVVTSSHDDVSKAIGASAFALAGGGFILRRRMSNKA